ncbi:hypothetical protein OIU84_002734 [Salix udensis]|uniref:Uncharacterized protein n=1 Tax=Salix udensis TaxID=889485 RepID=A0AAD6P5M8_9ROSI|nr:hypothetical protein OIU84_002734 [Salix udensis]
MLSHRPHAVTMQGVLSKAMDLIQSAHPTWESALLSNLLIFVAGSPILVSGLSLSGIFAAFLLGNLTWRAFGPSGFLLVASYFVLGTAATKVKMAQKEAQGVAEKRKGRRGPGSVIGSSAAGCPVSVLKLSDTVSSEIGKAYGKTTCFLKGFGRLAGSIWYSGDHDIKPFQGEAEGAVSAEGTLAGLLASILLASIGCILGEINAPEAVICVIASQIANVGESIIGAALQEKEGFQWLNNDVVNVINISVGSILAVLMQQVFLQT